MEKVVVIGGGIAGLETALRCERKGFSVTVVEPKDSMLFYPSAHRLLEGSSHEEFTIDYGRKFRGRNIEQVRQKAEGVKFGENRVYTEEGEELEYDYLVLAAGSETEFYDTPGHERADTMRFRENPQQIYRKLSEGEADSVAIVGGGATGVEAAASLLEVSDEHDFDLKLIHGSERLLPSNHEKLGRSAEKSLRKKGVELFLGEKAIEVGNPAVELESGDEVEADIVLWAGGVRPCSLVDQLDLECDRGGVRVDEYQQTSRENVFAAGDCCSYEGKVNRALYGIFEAKVAAENISMKSEEAELKQRSIPYDPEIIYLGSRDSAMEIGNFCMRGLFPSLLRSLGVEKRYLLLRKHWL
ncbi:MAG: NAD(P)/FAD-dependent oxidoreductase [Candidatus Nanohaloarchaea archaeon]